MLTTGLWAQAKSVTTFNDNFRDGRLDTSKWIASDGKAPGSVNQNVGSFSPDNLDFSQGMLRIRMTQTQTSTGIASSGGEIRTKQKFGYGVYEFTMRVASTSESPDSPGTVLSGGVSAGFSFINNSQTEIDIEAVGNQASDVHFTTWINPLPDKPPTIKQSTETSVQNPGEQFHTYGYAWYPGRVEWYIDGKLVSVHAKNVPSAPAYIIINHWGTNNEKWGGKASLGIPRYTYVKSVSYSPLGNH
jgi:beta-glucanase (GH16 family)